MGFPRTTVPVVALLAACTVVNAEVETGRTGRLSICDFRQDRDRPGRPRSKTVFYRPDGSVRKVIIVRPSSGVGEEFGRNGKPDSRREVPLVKEREEPPALAPSASSQDQRQRRQTLAKRGTVPEPRRTAPRWKSTRLKTRILAHKVTGIIMRKGEDLKGHINIYGLFGGRTTYHFKGRIKGHRVTARHHSGNRFRGKTTPNGMVQGTLKTKQGFRIPVKLPLRLP